MPPSSSAWPPPALAPPSTSRARSSASARARSMSAALSRRLLSHRLTPPAAMAVSRTTPAICSSKWYSMLDARPGGRVKSVSGRCSAPAGHHPAPVVENMLLDFSTAVYRCPGSSIHRGPSAASSGGRPPLARGKPQGHGTAGRGARRHGNGKGRAGGVCAGRASTNKRQYLHNGYVTDPVGTFSTTRPGSGSVRRRIHSAAGIGKVPLRPAWLHHVPVHDGGRAARTGR